MKHEKEVFAVWELKELPHEDNCGEASGLEEQCHISCGVGDDQWSGFFLEDDKGAKLLIEHLHKGGYKITLTAPALDLGEHKDYWLSPNTLGPNEVEAVDFGMRLVGPRSIRCPLS